MRRLVFGTLALIALLLAGDWRAVSPAQAAGRVYASPAEVEPLAPGEKVPEVRVESVGGEPIDLADRVREQGALLVFYRGGW